MGWSQYIIIHKDKAALEISRNLNIDYIDEDNLDKMNAYIESLANSEDNDNPKLKDLTIKDLTKLTNAYDLIMGFYDEEFLYLMLKKYYGNVEVVHEDKVPKGYQKIQRNYT